ncbi:MAG: glycosyltransferase, partial [bacterium]
MPVVVSDIPGNRTLVRHGETGLLAPVDDPQMLAEAILKAISGQPAILSMANAGRELVASQFSIQAVAEAHAELMELLLRFTKNGD